MTSQVIIPAIPTGVFQIPTNGTIVWTSSRLAEIVTAIRAAYPVLPLGSITTTLLNPTTVVISITLLGIVYVIGKLALDDCCPDGPCPSGYSAANPPICCKLDVVLPPPTVKPLPQRGSTNWVNAWLAIRVTRYNNNNVIEIDECFRIRTATNVKISQWVPITEPDEVIPPYAQCGGSVANYSFTFNGVYTRVSNPERSLYGISGSNVNNISFFPSITQTLMVLRPLLGTRVTVERMVIWEVHATNSTTDPNLSPQFVGRGFTSLNIREFSFDSVCVLIDTTSGLVYRDVEIRLNSELDYQFSFGPFLVRPNFDHVHVINRVMALPAELPPGDYSPDEFGISVEGDYKIQFQHNLVSVRGSMSFVRSTVIRVK